jgi:hypothetical protein
MFIMPNNPLPMWPLSGYCRVLDGGESGEVVGITRITNMVEGKETADPHGLAVVYP